MTPGWGTIPEEVAREVAVALGGGDPASTFASIDRLGGGCIHPASRIRTRANHDAFLKWSRDPGWHGFDVEARGLEALSAREGPRIPQVLAVQRGGPDRRGWILLEFVDQGPPGEDAPERFGCALARMHAPLEGARPGWDEDGFIGSLPQYNRAGEPTWPEFWRASRLEAQWESAERQLDKETRRSWPRLMDLVHGALHDVIDDGLSLLHGDLWSGNLLFDQGGGPVLVDPAVYRGHREVDLAMTELFGGIDPAFLKCYTRELPLRPGYAEVRRDLYQLYPLLVHVNLFGTGYAPGVADRVRRLLSRLA